MMMMIKLKWGRKQICCDDDDELEMRKETDIFGYTYESKGSTLHYKSPVNASYILEFKSISCLYIVICFITKKSLI